MSVLGTPRLGIVVIGRNEGERLVRCLHSVAAPGRPVVYVDSGSQDGSPVRARELGAFVVELTPDRPFTAARGRNEGFTFLTERFASVEHVQFVDGDVEVAPGWIDAAAAALDADSGIGVVTGRLRERNIDASIYNELCDLEWNRPVGEIHEFGGNAMHRARALSQAGLFDPTLIAGEEPELAARMKKRGWRFLRIDHDMGLHDAAMEHFEQWWKRALRAGHAYAEVNALHGAEPLRFWRREVRSNWAWGAALPAAGALLFVPTLGTSSMLVASGYAALFLKIRRGAKARGLPERQADLYAAFTALSKIPGALGQMKYWWGRATKNRSAIIEYKRSATR